MERFNIDVLSHKNAETFLSSLTVVQMEIVVVCHRDIGLEEGFL